MPRHPLVAVTAAIREEVDVSRVRVTAAYLRVIERAGLVPVVVAPFAHDASGATLRVLDAVDGIVLTGGEDVDPAAYGAAPSPHLQTVSVDRDTMEIALVRGARERALPTLAICRGIQLLNVALGGTLIQDIRSERSSDLAHDQSASRDQRTHMVHIEPDSRLARAVGATDVAVNSFHHQALDRIGRGLRVTAHAPDGIVEGVETPPDDRWWVLGVQWHPEEFVGDLGASDHGLFRAFAAAVRAGTLSSRTASAHRPVPVA
jgi:putative glutamine amidotransferase